LIKELLDSLYFKFEVFSSNVSFFSCIYIKFHEPSVKKEIKLADLLQDDKILHIGCGAIPYTAIVLAKKTNAHITCIDNKHQTIDVANVYLKKHNLLDKITIEHGEGTTYDVSKFDTVVISYGISCQDLVLKHVLSSIKKGAKIVLRRYTAEKNEYIDSIVKDFSVCNKKLLLTQNSIIIKKNQTQ